jgi:predicted DsbA family dithiol-disulfide isomerase
MRRANTFDAHRLLAWALHEHGVDQQRALKQRLLRAYFTDGLDVADHDVLASLAADVGLDRDAAAAFLATDDEAEFVHAERAEAYANGITAVPTFVIEGEWMLQGAHETEKWVRALTHIQSELATREP